VLLLSRGLTARARALAALGTLTLLAPIRLERGELNSSVFLGTTKLSCYLARSTAKSHKPRAIYLPTVAKQTEEEGRWRQGLMAFSRAAMAKARARAAIARAMAMAAESKLSQEETRARQIAK